MVCFHIVFDLQMFGHLPFGTTLHPVFYWHARLVAGSFLFLAGVSLWLAHGQGIRWPAFWRRWIKLAAAAGLVTIATYAALPEYFVYFGILHSIAASSLIGLLVLRLPATALAALGAAIMAASYILPSADANGWGLTPPPMAAFMNTLRTRGLVAHYARLMGLDDPLACEAMLKAELRTKVDPPASEVRRYVRLALRGRAPLLKRLERALGLWKLGRALRAQAQSASSKGASGSR